MCHTPSCAESHAAHRCCLPTSWGFDPFTVTTVYRGTAYLPSWLEDCFAALSWSGQVLVNATEVLNDIIQGLVTVDLHKRALWLVLEWSRWVANSQLLLAVIEQRSKPDCCWKCTQTRLKVAHPATSLKTVKSNASAHADWQRDMGVRPGAGVTCPGWVVPQASWWHPATAQTWCSEWRCVGTPSWHAAPPR